MNALLSGARVALAFFSIVLSIPAQAQAVRFVSTSGSDANSCTLAAPCRTIQRGVDETPGRGELRILDSGAYGGAVVIAKSMTISGDGATVILSGSPAITINRASAIVLRDFLLNGRGAGTAGDGIVVTNATAVHIVDCEIERFTGSGIVLPVTAVDTELFVSDSISRGNGANGLVVAGSGNNARLIVSHSRFENNAGNGIEVSGIESTITHSVLSGNTGNGISQAGAGSEMNVTWTTAANNGVGGYRVAVGAQMTLESSVARGNATGLFTISSGTIARISNSVFTNNTVGIENGAPVHTRGNNTVAGNGTDVSNEPALVDLPGT
jgi:hypothetical protein